MAVTVSIPEFVNAAPLDEDGNPVENPEVSASLSVDLDDEYDTILWELQGGRGSLAGTGDTTAVYTPPSSGPALFSETWKLTVTNGGAHVGDSPYYGSFPVFYGAGVEPDDIDGFAQTADRYGTMAILQWTEPTDGTDSYAIVLEPTGGGGSRELFDSFGSVEVGGTVYLLLTGLTPGASYLAGIRGESTFAAGDWAYAEVATAASVQAPGPPLEPAGDLLYNGRWASEFDGRVYAWWREPATLSVAGNALVKPGGDPATGYAVTGTITVSGGSLASVTTDVDQAIDGIEDTSLETSVVLGSDREVSSVSLTVKATNDGGQSAGITESF